MGTVIRLPDLHRHYYIARGVLNDPGATPGQIEAALAVLGASVDWMDIDLCHRTRARIRAPQVGARALTAAEPTALRRHSRQATDAYGTELLHVLAFITVVVGFLIGFLGAAP